MTRRTDEEWGRVAVSLPGWRWLPGMRATDAASTKWRILAPPHVFPEDPSSHAGTPTAEELVPDIDDMATAGAMVVLLGESFSATTRGFGSWKVDWSTHNPAGWGHATGLTLGQALVAAAEKVGRWPGGAE